MNQDMNISQGNISTNRMLDDELLERFNDKSSRNRQHSITNDPEEYNKELQKVDQLFHKNEDAFAHLLNIRGTLLDMYLANNGLGPGNQQINKKGKGRATQA